MDKEKLYEKGIDNTILDLANRLEELEKLVKNIIWELQNKNIHVKNRIK